MFFRNVSTHTELRENMGENAMMNALSVLQKWLIPKAVISGGCCATITRQPPGVLRLAIADQGFLLHIKSTGNEL